eukprot:TRINITY_DN412_c0_g1_i6.p1 TRINITY_DN412_c0_g1~~TRINITY_DN412_c0_g1_i6.p1  ORF type:complete len:123 (-),score=30.95 TRINITY_DN412_c0_g1_i6:205-573(-)
MYMFMLILFLYLFIFCILLLFYIVFFFFLMIRRPPRSTQSRSSAASDVYKRQSLVFLGCLLDACSTREGALTVDWKVVMHTTHLAPLVLAAWALSTLVLADSAGFFLALAAPMFLLVSRTLR